VSDDAQGVRVVREVVARYVDATYRGDVAALRACFHPSAVMCGYLGEELITGDPERFFEDIGATPAMESTGAPYVAETTSVEVAGDAASVRLEETGFFGSVSFINWLHLIRDQDGEWRIVSKLFAMRPAEDGA
jgi:ketosteroid isomerase-like protein